MVVDPPFLLDSNFFIQAYRLHYPLDVVPGFWLKVKELAENGTIISVDKVQQEIFQNKDDLTAWCSDNLPMDFFKNTSVVLPSYIEVVNWANSKAGHYKPSALNEFLDADEADAWLVSYAKAHGNKLVTHEVGDPAGRKKIKIPDAAAPFGIKCYTTIEMFRELKQAF